MKLTGFWALLWFAFNLAAYFYVCDVRDCMFGSVVSFLSYHCTLCNKSSARANNPFTPSLPRRSINHASQHG